MEGYWFERKILASDCDRYQRLRNSSLLRFLQEASIADVERVGVTRDKTLDRGFLWAVARIAFAIQRPVLYDEKVVVSTWAGKSRHMLFPRFYEVKDQSGNQIVHASAVWVLISAETRKAILPESYGIDVPGEAFAEPLPSSLKALKHVEMKGMHEVQYSEIDLNGHVNNTRYMDWLDDLAGMDVMKDTFTSCLHINFERECSWKEQVKFYCDKKDELFRIDGVIESGTAFAAEERRQKL